MTRESKGLANIIVTWLIHDDDDDPYEVLLLACVNLNMNVYDDPYEVLLLACVKLKHACL
jgi:hypothetical protein